VTGSGKTLAFLIPMLELLQVYMICLLLLLLIKHEWQNKASSAHTLLHDDKNMFEKAEQKLSD